MSIDFSVWTPGEPLAVEELRKLVGKKWRLLVYEVLQGDGAGSIQVATLASGGDVVGWQDKKLTLEKVARVLEEDRLDDLLDRIGVVELTVTHGSELQKEAKAASKGQEAAVAAALRKARTSYLISAPAGSEADYTPDLQDALLMALGGLDDSVTEIDGEFSTDAMEVDEEDDD